MFRKMDIKYNLSKLYWWWSNGSERWIWIYKLSKLYEHEDDDINANLKDQDDEHEDDDDGINDKGSVAEFKEFERWFKFKPRLKYGWFHLKLYQMFQDLSLCLF